MKKYKRLTCLFTILALLLSHIMCGVVSYNYGVLRIGGEYAGYSAPASTAFLLCIPYGAGILICAILAVLFDRKHKKSL